MRPAVPLLARLVGVTADHVELRPLTCPGRSRIAGLSVGRVRTQHERPVHRASLGERRGQRIAVLEAVMPNLRIRERQPLNGTASGALQDEFPSTLVDLGDCPPLPVQHPEPVVVVPGDDPVADSVAAVAHEHLLGTELPGFHQVQARTLVEVVDVVVAKAEHDDPTAVRRRGVGLRPVAHQLLTQVVAGARARDASGFVVRRHRDADVPRPELAQTRALPRITLPMVGSQLNRVEPVGQSAERPARVDLRQLPQVADEHELAVSTADVVLEFSQRPTADLAGLVDDEHGPGR